VKFEVKSPTLVETMMQIMEIGFKAYIVYICWRLSQLRPLFTKPYLGLSLWVYLLNFCVLLG